MPPLLKASESTPQIANMCNSIKFCANQLLVTLGCQCHYKTGNPFKWMEMISLQGKTNFFKKVLANTPNRVLGLIAWNNPSLLMPAFNASNTHTHIKHTKCTGWKYIHYV
jgi:hypothetical protein